MADNIDNLSFGIILKDEDFKKKMNEVKGLAKTFSDDIAKALALTNALQAAQGKGGQGQEKKAKVQKDIVNLTREELEARKAAGNITDAELHRLKLIAQTDKAISNEKKQQLDIEKKQLDIQDKKERMARRRARAEGDTGRRIELISNALLQQSSIMKGLSSMAASYFSVFGAAAVVRNLVRITGEFEAQHTALRAILQDNAAADNIYNQLQVLAVKSPFTFQNLVGYAKQLTAFSVPVNEVYETTKKLADVSAGLGVDMGRIILAYGQVRSAEFLRGQEVRQFTEAGIPILKELADQIQEVEGRAISVGEIFDRISARQIPFAMVEEAFNRMTSAGGKFYQMQEVLAETVKGKVSNLQDAWEIMLSKIGDENSGTIKGIVDGLTGLFANYEKWIGILGTVIKDVGIYSAAMLALNTITKAANGIQLLRNGILLFGNQQVKLSTALLPTNIALQRLSIKNTQEEAAALAALNLARKSAVGVMSILAAAIWTVIGASGRRKEEARKTTDIINAALTKLSVTMADFKIGTDKVEAAFVRMKSAEGDATVETKEFNKSVDDLKKQFPKFIDDHIRMAETVDDLGKYWAQARLEMNQYYADEARGSLTEDLKSNREEQNKKLQKDFDKYIQGLVPKKIWMSSGKNLSTLLWRYVIGEIDREQISPYVSELGALFNKKQGNEIDYFNSILDELDKYVGRFNGISDEYQSALRGAEDAITASGLSTTRKIINEFAATLADGASLLIGGEESLDKFAARLRDYYASDNVSDDIKSSIKAIFDQFPKQLGAVSTELAGWQKDVNEIIRNFNATSEGNTLIKELDETAVQNEVIDRWKKDLDDVQASLAVIPLKYRNLQNQTYVDLKARQSLLETISQNLYGNKTFDGTTKVAKVESDVRVRALKREADTVKELMETYKRWKELKIFSDEEINNILRDIYKNTTMVVGAEKKVSETLFDRIKREEGFREKAYRDTGGVWTIGYGFTKGVKEGDTITREQADQRLKDEINAHSGYLNSLLARGVKMSQNQYEALLDLAYNAGEGAVKQLYEKYDGNLQEMGQHLLDYRIKDKSGNVLKGLIARREREYEMFFTDSVLDSEEGDNEGKLILDFDKKIGSIIRRLKSLGEKGREAASQVESMFARTSRKDDVSQIEDYQKRVAKYIEEAKTVEQKIADLEKSMDEDLAKATTDEQRQGIIAHYTDEIDKLRESLVDLTSIQLTDFWQQLMGEKNGTYRNLTRLQEKAGELIGILKGIEPNRNKDGKITGYTLTQGNAGDFLKSIGVDAQSLQLSVAQVEALNKAFESLFGRRAEKNGMSALFDMIKKRSFKGFWKDVKDGSGPAVETLTEAAEQLSQIGSIFTELGEAAGSGFLSSFGETMSFFGDVAGQIAKRDYIAAVGVTVKALASGITDALALKRAIGEAADEAERFNTEARLSSGVDTIFGENTLTKVRNAMSVMNEYSDAVAREREWSGKTVRWKAGIFGWDRGFGRLSRIVGELGYDLYDSYGNLNAEALQAILDKYDKLTDKSREWITEALRDSEMYAEAVEQLDDVVEGVFGSIADDLTDTFIDNFVQMGYAVDDLGDTFTNLGDMILRSMLKSYIMDEILDKYGERARELMKRAADGTASADETAEGVRKLAEDVESDARLLAPTIQEIIEAFKDRGLINVDSSGDSSLSGGIKGITEDTANLLASYLNAIRADVSYGKAQWERIAAAVEGHSMQYVTLNDYLMQVQANTANIAESNRKILDRIESVLTSEGGLPAIRTYS